VTWLPPLLLLLISHVLSYGGTAPWEAGKTMGKALIGDETHGKYVANFPFLLQKRAVKLLIKGDWFFITF